MHRERVFIQHVCHVVVVVVVVVVHSCRRAAASLQCCGGGGCGKWGRCGAITAL